MEFFDKLGKKASKTYKGAAEKTSKIAKETKLKMAINECNTKINNEYKAIGEYIYNKHLNKEKIAVDDQLKISFKTIDSLNDEIEENYKLVLSLKNMKKCEKCGNEMEIEANFCPDCGKKQPEIVVEEPEEAKDVEVVEEENKE